MPEGKNTEKISLLEVATEKLTMLYGAVVKDRREDRDRHHKQMDGQQIYMEEIRAENHKQHGNLFSGINELKVQLAKLPEQIKDSVEEKVKEAYATKESVKNVKDNVDRVDNLLNKMVVIVASMLVGVTGWALVTLFQYITKTVQAYF